MVGKGYNYEVAAPAESTATAKPVTADNLLDGTWRARPCEYSSEAKSNWNYFITFSSHDHTMEKVIAYFSEGDGKTCTKLRLIVNENYTYRAKLTGKDPFTIQLDKTAVSKLQTKIKPDIRVASTAPAPQNKIGPEPIASLEIPIKCASDFDLLQIKNGNLYFGLRSKQPGCTTAKSRPTRVDTRHPYSNSIQEN